MTFNINTELAEQGVVFDESSCVFSDSYQGATTEEAKRSIMSAVSIANILFPIEITKPNGKRAIQNHGWRELETGEIIRAPLCLHSFVFQAGRESREVNNDEIKIISGVFEQVAQFLSQAVTGASSQSEQNEADCYHQYLNEHGFQVEEDEGKYLNVRLLAEHYLNISKSPELLLKVSKAFLQVHSPLQSRRITELQKYVSLAALTPHPASANVRRSRESAESGESPESGEGEIHRVDLSNYKPRIRRPRRASSKLIPVTKNGRAIFVTKPKDDAPSTAPAQEEGWCAIL